MLKPCIIPREVFIYRINSYKGYPLETKHSGIIKLLDEVLYNFKPKKGKRLRKSLFPAFSNNSKKRELGTKNEKRNIK